jgi:hypothetical protein
LGRSAQVADFKDPTPSAPRPLTSPPFGHSRRLAETPLLLQAPKHAGPPRAPSLAPPLTPATGRTAPPARPSPSPAPPPPGARGPKVQQPQRQPVHHRLPEHLDHIQRQRASPVPHPVQKSDRWLDRVPAGASALPGRPSPASALRGVRPSMGRMLAEEESGPDSGTSTPVELHHTRCRMSARNCVRCASMSVAVTGEQAP